MCILNILSCIISISIEDAGFITGGEIRNEDGRGGSTGDSCYDVIVDNQGATLDEFAFKENLKIPCQGNDGEVS